jgi:hypothetical protein
MPEPARYLHLVDTTTGEAHPLSECPGCKIKDDEIKGLQRDIRGWAARYAELERDREAEARASKHWPAAVEVFEAWRAATGAYRRTKDGKRNTEWTSERFWLIEPYLRRKKYGYEMCLRGVAGIAFDHFKTTRRNGSLNHHDDWDLLFRGPDKFEGYCNRAPRGWREDPIFAKALGARDV